MDGFATGPASSDAAPRAASALARLLESWGGATIAYRRRLIDSPSYTLNHEEVEKALEEGVRFAEGLTPTAVECDARGHAAGLRVRRRGGRGERRSGKESQSQTTKQAHFALPADEFRPGASVVFPRAARWQTGATAFETLLDAAHKSRRVQVAR